MTKKMVKAGLAALIAAPLALAGCSTASEEPTTAGGTGDSGSGSSGGETIAVVTHGTPGDAFWDVVKSGAEQAGDDLGVTVTYQGDGDPVEQSQLIQAAVASDIDGLIVSMSNPDGVRGAVEEAVAAGVPVITINSGLEQSQEFGAQTHVGQSEFIAGQGAGEQLGEAGVTNLVCIVHEAGNTGLEDRCAGAADTMGGTVSNVQVDVANVADAQNTIESQLLSDDSIDGVLTLNPGIAVAAAQAIESSGSTAQLATFDVSEDVLELVQDGGIIFAVDQQPYAQGYVPVSLLTLQARNGDVVGGGHPIYSGPGFITQENAAQVAEFAENGTR
ncbi:sugar ABC transporter substrate-binding protein [Ruania rhizosphaerae]|uniref:sugar ABC transporter substrate-binding protein n=1 Tax=Ruania rhizosphaerae TaxID=1840413 RepID=UPI001358FE85|nr:sugar ABC transporter substrate-binding protein [Ruania rhizosphaerae]